MEFDKDKPVSDEERRLAEAKKVTVQPIHTNITPDDISDSEIAASHINGQPIANPPNDIEQDTPPVRHLDSTESQADPKTRKQALSLIAVTLVVAGLAIGASLYFVLR
jgi:hypothetical protein